MRLGDPVPRVMGTGKHKHRDSLGPCLMTSHTSLCTTTTAPTVIAHLDGVRFDAQIRGHHITLDQPLGVGEDVGPTPLELLGAAIGSCVALYVKQFCQARSIPYEGIRVEVRENKVRNPSRITDFAVDVRLPTDLSARNAMLIEQVARSCPVHNTLVHGAGVRVSIESGVSVAA